MSALNWGQVKKNMDAAKAKRFISRRFIIKNGETVPVRILVNPNEPFIFKRHYVNATKQYLVCAEDAALAGQHEGCVACDMARAGGRSSIVKLPQIVYAISLYDPRKIHKVEYGQETKYELCTEDARCRHCRMGNKPTLNGVRHWTMNESVANQLREFEINVLGNRCMCGVGMLKVIEFICPNCQAPMEPDNPNDAARCQCGQIVYPQPVHKCSRCNEPRPMSLADTWLIITRAGEGTSTSYNFNPGEVEPFSFTDDIKPLDFAHDPEFQPLAAQQMAGALRVPGQYAAPQPDWDNQQPTSNASSFQMRDPKTMFRR